MSSSTTQREICTHPAGRRGKEVESKELSRAMWRQLGVLWTAVWCLVTNPSNSGLKHTATNSVPVFFECRDASGVNSWLLKEPRWLTLSPQYIFKSGSLVTLDVMYLRGIMYLFIFPNIKTGANNICHTRGRLYLKFELSYSRNVFQRQSTFTFIVWVHFRACTSLLLE